MELQAGQVLANEQVAFCGTSPGPRESSETSRQSSVSVEKLVFSFPLTPGPKFHAASWANPVPQTNRDKITTNNPLFIISIVYSVCTIPSTDSA